MVSSMTYDVYSIRMTAAQLYGRASGFEEQAKAATEAGMRDMWHGLSLQYALKAARRGAEEKAAAP
jgi:hypothetical protein